jgi:hypothetical protein
MNPDSELMLFVSEQELQSLRDMFDKSVAILNNYLVSENTRKSGEEHADEEK